MKILKYGEGYPKTCTCEHCESELEYEIDDVYYYYKQNYSHDNKLYYVEKYKTVDCPVCHHSVNLEVLLVQYPIVLDYGKQITPKKRWWQI